MEEWKDIKGYEGIYQVSNEGRVKSLERDIKINDNGTVRHQYDHILKPKKDNKGYLILSLCNDGKRKFYKVNRLVAQAFIENPDNLPCTNHKNCIPGDNRVENLEWCDYLYNNHYGNRIEKASAKMVNNPKISKIVYKYSLDDELIAEYPSANEAQRDMGIKVGRGVSMCCRGLMNTYKGFKWSYTKKEDIN